jgi:hypothetical protein
VVPVTTDEYGELKRLLALAVADDKNMKTPGDDPSWYLLMGASAIISHRWSALTFPEPQSIRV